MIPQIKAILVLIVALIMGFSFAATKFTELSTIIPIGIMSTIVVILFGALLFILYSALVEVFS